MSFALIVRVVKPSSLATDKPHSEAVCLRSVFFLKTRRASGTDRCSRQVTNTVPGLISRLEAQGRIRGVVVRLPYRVKLHRVLSVRSAGIASMARNPKTGKF